MSFYISRVGVLPLNLDILITWFNRGLDSTGIGTFSSGSNLVKDGRFVSDLVVGSNGWVGIIS